MISFLTHLKTFLLKVIGVNKLKQLVTDIRITTDSVHKIEAQSQRLELLINVIDERSRTLESIMTIVDKKLEKLEKLTGIVEERTRTLEFVANQSQYILNYQADQQHKLYVELFSNEKKSSKSEFFDFRSEIELKTDFPIAIQSNDHLMPDSTSEGLSRPTLFVRNCIDVLGGNIKTLDIGTGAAGLVYEWAINDIYAAGIDGSDFCKKNLVGYWPLLPNNLFTCDITKPFSFVSTKRDSMIGFDIITSWEVLEHIAESDLENLFNNIKNHLNDNGYFIGSISLVSYADHLGNPYHVTLKPRAWWQEAFKECGLEMVDEHPFNETVFCRGNGPRFQDFHNYRFNPEDGFLFVAKVIAEKK